MSRTNQSYTVTIFGAMSDPSHRHGMTSKAAAVKHAKVTAEEQKGKTVEVYGTWYERGSVEAQHETLRFRWDDAAKKVKERK